MTSDFAPEVAENFVRTAQKSVRDYSPALLSDAACYIRCRLSVCSKSITCTHM